MNKYNKMEHCIKTNEIEQHLTYETPTGSYE